MKIKAITLDRDELPETITVEMTRAEAILIVRHVGSLRPSTATSDEMYEALAGSLFNRFWDDGVAEAASEQEQAERTMSDGDKRLLVERARDWAHNGGVIAPTQGTIIALADALESTITNSREQSTP